MKKTNTVDDSWTERYYTNHDKMWYPTECDCHELLMTIVVKSKVVPDTSVILLTDLTKNELRKFVIKSGDHHTALYVDNDTTTVDYSLYQVLLDQYSSVMSWLRQVGYVRTNVGFIDSIN